MINAISINRTLIFSFALALILSSKAPAAYSQAVKTPAEIPFEFVHNQIVVQVKIGGKGPLNMLIDTDTDPSAIDTATARELGLVTGTQGSTATGGGTETNVVYTTRLPSVEVGAVTARDVAAATIDLTKLSGKIERPIHGVLGYSFLKDRIVQIDYPNSKLRFFAESPYPNIQLGPNTVNVVAFPFRYDDGQIIIDGVFINNQKMKATLDTGSSGTFCLTPEAVTTLDLDEQGREVETDSVGYNGGYKTKSGLLKSVRLGKLSIDSVPATFWLPKTGHDNKSFQINIGNGFFQDYMLTFDFRKKVVVFERLD